MMETGPQRGFSVASILLLTAMVAILMAALRIVFLQFEEIPENWLGIPVAGVLVGGVVGSFVGARNGRTAWGGFFGFGGGLVVGAAAGFIVLVSGSLAVLGVGAAVIVLFALVVRLLSGGRGRGTGGRDQPFSDNVCPDNPDPSLTPDP